MSNPISVVVDADIARSSGLTEHPVSSSSRELLELVSSNGHILVLCPSLRAEWNNHKSRFAMTWLVSMISRKKVKFIKRNEGTEDLIHKNLDDPKKIDIAVKDSHLIDAALIADKFIASNDNTARSVFCELSASCGVIKNIKWFNAISDRDILCDYLKRQCYVPKDYFIGGDS